MQLPAMKTAPHATIPKDPAVLAVNLELKNPAARVCLLRQSARVAGRNITMDKMSAAECEMRERESSKKVETLQKEGGIIEEGSRSMPSYFCL